MLFTWDTQDLCIVFRSWHVSSTLSLIGALIGVVLLTAGYELVREISRRYETRTARRVEALPSKSLFYVYTCSSKKHENSMLLFCA
jgi:solute carrier family 31 (copper transporter), member 1